MQKSPDDVALKIFGVPLESLDERRKAVTHHVARRKHIARDPTHELESKTTAGQRAADAVASFGGSWPFIGLFLATMVVWVSVNSLVLARYGTPFDPFPYILLNLFLSMLAAIQAPIILMSQNRQAQKDRLTAEHDYEINLKAEVEIMMLHDKVDSLRQQQWDELIEIQQKQVQLLQHLIDNLVEQRPGH